MQATHSDNSALISESFSSEREQVITYHEDEETIAKPLARKGGSNDLGAEIKDTDHEAGDKHFPDAYGDTDADEQQDDDGLPDTGNSRFRNENIDTAGSDEGFDEFDWEDENGQNSRDEIPCRPSSSFEFPDEDGDRMHRLEEGDNQDVPVVADDGFQVQEDGDEGGSEDENEDVRSTRQPGDYPEEQVRSVNGDPAAASSWQHAAGPNVATLPSLPQFDGDSASSDSQLDPRKLSTYYRAFTLRENESNRLKDVRARKGEASGNKQPRLSGLRKSFSAEDIEVNPTSPTSPGYPDYKKAVCWEDGVHLPDPSPRPRSAPPRMEPASDFDWSNFDWSDDEDISEEEEKTDTENQVSGLDERESWETLQASSKPLAAEYGELRPKTGAECVKRSQSEEYLREQRNIIREERDERTFLHMQTDQLNFVLDNFDFRAVSLRFQLENQGRMFSGEERRIMEMVKMYWAEDLGRLKHGWRRDTEQWRERHEKWSAAWASERGRWAVAWEKEKKKWEREHKLLIEALKQAERALARSNYWSMQLDTSKKAPGAKLSLVFGESLATSPTSLALPGSVACDGGLKASDAVEAVIPEGMATTSPASPERSSQTPKEILRGKESVPPRTKPTLKKRVSVAEGKRTQSVPEPTPDVGFCTSGLNLREFEDVEGKAEVVKEELAKFRERCFLSQAMLLHQDTEKTQMMRSLVSKAADTIERIQIRLLAEQQEIISVERALGMTGDDIIISLSEISTRIMREPPNPSEALEQRERVREEAMGRLFEIAEEVLRKTHRIQTAQQGELECVFPGGKFVWELPKVL